MKNLSKKEALKIVNKMLIKEDGLNKEEAKGIMDQIEIVTIHDNNHFVTSTQYVTCFYEHNYDKNKWIIAWSNG